MSANGIPLVSPDSFRSAAPIAFWFIDTETIGAVER